MSSSFSFRIITFIFFLIAIWSIAQISQAPNTDRNSILSNRAIIDDGTIQSDQTSVSDRDDTASKDLNSSLRKEIALLRIDLAKLKQNLQQLSQSDVSVGRLDQEVNADSITSESIDFIDLELQSVEQEQNIVEKEHNRSLARMEASETTLQQEPVDNNWSMHTAETIQESLESTEFTGTAVQDVECRSTLCRLEIIHNDLENQEIFHRHFSLKVGQILPKMVVHSEQQDNGEISSMIYMARSGHGLPVSEQTN